MYVPCLSGDLVGTGIDLRRIRSAVGDQLPCSSIPRAKLTTKRRCRRASESFQRRAIGFARVRIRVTRFASRDSLRFTRTVSPRLPARDSSCVFPASRFGAAACRSFLSNSHSHPIIVRQGLPITPMAAHFLVLVARNNKSRYRRVSRTL